MKRTVQVTEKEWALLLLMRRLQFGHIEAVAFRNGEPVVVQNVVQRINLDREDELRALLEGEGPGAELAPAKPPARKP